MTNCRVTEAWRQFGRTDAPLAWLNAALMELGLRGWDLAVVG